MTWEKFFNPCSSIIEDCVHSNGKIRWIWLYTDLFTRNIFKCILGYERSWNIGNSSGVMQLRRGFVWFEKTLKIKIMWLKWCDCSQNDSSEG